MLTDTASVVEVLWSLASGLAMLVHSWLSGQAWIDWRASVKAERLGLSPHWREISAGWYLVGQTCLFLPKLFELGIGVLAMTMPPPVSEQVQEAAAWSQWILILSVWIGAGGAIAFWMARRALETWGSAEH